MSAPKYTVEPGRGIARTTDGTVLVNLHRAQEEPRSANSYATGVYPLAPWEADDLTHEVVLGLNHHETLRTALERLIERFTPRSKIDGEAIREARGAADAYDAEKARRA